MFAGAETYLADNKIEEANMESPHVMGQIRLEVCAEIRVFVGDDTADGLSQIWMWIEP